MRPYLEPIITVAAVGLAIIGGVALGYSQAEAKCTKAWEQVIVVKDGKIIPNPEDLTPRQLAVAQIIDRQPTLIGFGCEGMGRRAMVGQEFDEFPTCREIKTLN